MPCNSRFSIVAFVLLSARVAAADGAPSATLPLEEVLRLYRASEAKDSDDEPPPLRATVGKLEMSGRLLDGAIEIAAQVEVTVLGDGWTTVPLFEKDARTSVARLPSVDGASFAVVGGQLAMVTAKAGTYRFEVALRKAAVARGPRQRVEIACGGAALALLRLRFDDNLFRLEGGVPDGDGVVLYPQDGRFAIEWERLGPARARAEERPRRPPVESVVSAAHASIVATLDGRTLTRLLYQLRLEGAQSIEIALAEGQTLERAFVNGAAVPLAPRGRALRVEVAPARAGDESARLELVLGEKPGGWFLSGQRDYALPSLSWGVNELWVTLSLPQVFNYKWAGGSLAPADKAPEVEWSHAIPTPGKAVTLHQQLVAGGATARIAYTVDLSDSYYKGP
jgi:hypothetical protein